MSAPACIPTEPWTPVRLLTVGVEEPDRRDLHAFLNGAECSLYRAVSRKAARKLVRSRHPNVVISEQSFVDGTWQDLLADLQAQANPPALIVCSLLADDRLWAEVLNIGGYDVLMKPFRPVEVSRVVKMAARQFASKRAPDTLAM